MAKAVNMRPDMAPHRNRIRRRAIARRRVYVAMLLRQRKQVRRMGRMVRHSHKVGLGQIINAGVESEIGKFLVHSAQFINPLRKHAGIVAYIRLR